MTKTQKKVYISKHPVPDSGASNTTNINENLGDYVKSGTGKVMKERQA
jgi:hypothetical protein